MKVDIINLFAAEGTVCPQLLSLMNPLYVNVEIEVVCRLVRTLSTEVRPSFKMNAVDMSFQMKLLREDFLTLSTVVLPPLRLLFDKTDFAAQMSLEIFDGLVANLTNFRLTMNPSEVVCHAARNVRAEFAHGALVGLPLSVRCVDVGFKVFVLFSAVGTHFVASDRVTDGVVSLVTGGITKLL